MSGVIVHEWLEQVGGAEKVVDRFAAVFPDAPIHVLWNDAPDRFASERVHESFLARTSLRRHKAVAVPAMLSAWRHLGATDAEWMLVSSHLFAHHARFAGRDRDMAKLVFCHSPARYIWEPDLDTRGDGVAQRLASLPLRAIDRSRAQEATDIAVVSEFVRERVERCWDRDARIIHPPVDVRTFGAATETLSAEDAATLDGLPSEYLLGASRFVTYKRLDLVISAGATSGLPVVLAGDGPRRRELEDQAEARGVRVVFVGRTSDDLLRELYRRAVAYVFPPVEDFGIMPLEAMAAGTPVIANRLGGAAETVVDGVTGFLVEDFGGSEVRDALERVRQIDTAALTTRAEAFDSEVFDANISEWVKTIGARGA
ncbi:glycosyltransferase [Microbacterium tenebrionis]|uniref:glycosyltransferase n=1 Tax=Microbacterium tenebrionis TaxID=2830665 RepID=UPI00158CE10A|nr:glycosyltransferase [Microbacterium ihumii]